MQTTPETQLHDEYAIYQTILHARNRRLTHDYEINTEDTPENFQRDMLLGYCHENSLAAAEHLAEHYDPIIVWGALTDKDDFHPDTRLEAEQNGLVHFWIELEDDEPEPIVAEIATETTTVTGTLPGDPLVMRGRPNDYTVPDNCRFQYDPAIHSKDLCNEEGYRKLVGNGHRLS